MEAPNGLERLVIRWDDGARNYFNSNGGEKIRNFTYHVFFEVLSIWISEKLSEM